MSSTELDAYNAFIDKFESDGFEAFLDDDQDEAPQPSVDLH
ncbi:hypothetical protein HNO88_004415 [Novosphingobium chloroacetimidivorans]|uniref:Uncharacterized protein n=1 Tax=Novosphingobium chloroacetimidivorans TaxID=1428314 RepID=A0A7W7NZC1_9SPHN|nr:hypothetical protein [Novosphingobium chloroacetimidivorans]